MRPLAVRGCRLYDPAHMTTLAITGTRHGRPDVEAQLDLYARVFGAPTLVVVCGDRNGQRRSHRGVDLQAYNHTRLRGWPGLAVYADWDAHGRAAGPLRNGRAVARAGAGAHLLAFPDERARSGTRDCFAQGVAAGLLCVEVADGWVARLQELIALRRGV